MIDIFIGVLIILFALVAAVFDIKMRRIPNKLVLSMLGVWLVLTVFVILTSPETAYDFVMDSLFGLLSGGGIFLTVYLVSRKGLGAGDVKFMSIAGLYLGLGSTIPAILYGTILASITGLVLIAFKKISKKDKIPLAPFLLAGITLTVVSSIFF